MKKYATFQIIASSYAVPSGRRIKTAHRVEFDYDPRPGYLYVRSRAISSRCNDNFDEFPAPEIKESYKTFIGKPVFVNHHNQNHRRARGVIIDAALHEDRNPDGTPDTWVEVLMEVDANKFPKLAEAIVKGEIERTSMGTDVEYSECSYCGNKAHTVAEFCSHIPRLKGQRIRKVLADGSREDVLVSEICHGLRFFENSLLVEEPADPTAYFLGVDARGLQMAAGRRHKAFGGQSLSRVASVRKQATNRGTADYGGSGTRGWESRKTSRAGARDYGVEHSMDMSKQGSSSTELVVPPKVDTLRDTTCPMCFGPEALIRTEDGYIPIASVEVGDRVLTIDGTFREVTAVYEREFDGVAYEFQAKSMTEPVIVTPEHPIYALVADHFGHGPTCQISQCRTYESVREVTNGANRGTIKHELKFVHAHALELDGRVATAALQDTTDLEEIVVPNQFLGTRASKRDLRNGPDRFALTEDFLWAVGLYIAEGSNSKRTVTFSLHEKESEYIDRLEHLFGNLGYTVATHRNGTHGVSVEVYSTTLAQWFPQWLGHGCENKAVPAELLNLPLDRLSHVMQGVFDGDGVKKTGNIRQTSQILAAQMAEWALRKGFTPTQSLEVQEGKKDVYDTRGLSHLMDHHWEIEGHSLSQIKSVRPIPYAGTVFNLEVEGNHTYVIENVVVHNCGDEDFNGEECNICLYKKPPDIYMDPDTSKAQDLDDLRDVDEDAQLNEEALQPSLRCDLCGFEPEIAENTGTDVVTTPIDNGMDPAEHGEPFTNPDGAGAVEPNRTDPTQTPPSGADLIKPQEPEAGGPCPECGEGKLVEDVTQDDGQTGNQDNPIAEGDATDDKSAPGSDSGSDSDSGGDSDSKGSDDSNPFAKKDDDSKDADSGDKDSKGDGDSKDDDDSGDDDDPKKKKDSGNPFAKKDSVKHSPNPEKSTQTVNSKQRKANTMPVKTSAQVIAENSALIKRQGKQIARLTLQNRQLQSAVAQICAAAGLRLVADIKNPGQPVAAPASEPAAFTTEQTRNQFTPDDPSNIGASGLTNVSPDAETKPDTIGGQDAWTPPNVNQKVTAPTSGTEEQLPYDQTVTRPNVEFGNPLKPDYAFPLGGVFAPPASLSTPEPSAADVNVSGNEGDPYTARRRARARRAAAQRNGGRKPQPQPRARSPRVNAATAAKNAEARVFAAQRLARLRITAGIAQGSDLTEAKKITSTMSDNEIAAEIKTLSAVTQKSAAAAPRNRRLVPQTGRTASRAPSLSGATSSLGSTVAGISEDELLLDFGPSAE